MKVFISWSKERSKKVALLLRNWMQCVIQSSEPWMSDIDIDRGAVWMNDINGNLNSSATGIICLTKSNVSEPWVLFEAGALSKGLETNRVCCLLIDIEPSDISGPLSQFNHTKPLKEDIRKLIFNLNERSEKILDPKILEQVFETHWLNFENEFNNIIKETEKTDNKVLPERGDKDILYEILNTTRQMNKRITYLENSIFTKENQLSEKGKSFTKYSKVKDYLNVNENLLPKNNDLNENNKNTSKNFVDAYRTRLVNFDDTTIDNNK